MVKVLENKVVDLDLLPGKEQQELKAQAQAQLDKAGWERGIPLTRFWTRDVLTLFNNRDQVKVATDKLPPEQKKQVEGFAGNAANVATGVAGTAGGAIKGVLDTTGNTVCFAQDCRNWDRLTVERNGKVQEVILSGRFFSYEIKLTVPLFPRLLPWPAVWAIQSVV